MRHIAKQSFGIAMCLFFALTANAQIYNSASKKVVAGQLGEIIWKDGIHNNCDARFGTLIAKERRNGQSSSKQIGIPIIYVNPTQEGANGLPVFVLGGGPGESNLANTMFFEQIVRQNPLVMIGYRGVDGNTRLDCPCLLNAVKNMGNGHNADSYQLAIDSCADNWSNQLIDIQGYSITEVVNDIEDVRVALEIDKFHVVAFSYGTMLVQMYAQRFPGHIARNVIIAPRLLYDFEIHTADIANLDRQINKLLAPDNEFIIKRIIDQKDAFGANSEQFLLYSYTKLYSIDGIRELMKLASQDNDSISLQKSIDAFLASFSSKIALGDIIAKKSGNHTIHNSEPTTPNGYEPMAKSANNWFNSASQSVTESPQTQPNDIPTLIICGDLDIVAPTETTRKQLQAVFRNSKAVTIRNAGHTDLLGAQREETEKSIVNFLKR